MHSTLLLLTERQKHKKKIHQKNQKIKLPLFIKQFLIDLQFFRDKS